MLYCKLTSVSIIRLGILFVIAACCFAEPGDSLHKLSPVSSLWAWTTEEWTGNDQPYHQIRAGIDQDVAHGHFTSATVEQYWVQREKDHNSPETLFRWVYAAYQAQQTHPPLHLKQFPGPGAFAYTSSPHTYEYTRLRFLINAEYEPHPEIVSLGKRLLRRDPSDYDVEYYLVKSCKPWLSNVEKQETLFYAEDLIRRNPAKPSAYAALGDVYGACWAMKQAPADATKAIAAYQDYLRLAPADYAGRSQVEKLIYRIQHYQSSRHQ